ncbi:CFEM domain-containing protein [Colletotrichum karsti]|uniref:CFEM domain-containing protein n=1 Tax=Colletotrichum karsti TaxID=1095194 RepID=A0A9P6LIG2_9PEZI|nr:CFEM domain-containing protein [Colletotrichum karsti]KAF9873675.1 CFEM domain-containing protein [Colletotrichum karsti]
MQFSIATIVAVAGLVAAQIDGIPQCAVTCLNNAAASAKCTAGDLSCLCSPANYQAVVVAGGPCIVSSCGADVATNQVLPAAGRLCAAVVGGGGPASTVASVVSSARASISSAVQSAASVAASVSSRVASASSARASASASRASVSAAISSRVSQATAALTSAAAPGTRTVAVTNVVTSRNGTATATSTVTPVSVNGASVQGPVGVLAVLAVAVFAAL